MFPAKKAAARLQHAALCALASVSLLSSPFASATTAPTIKGTPATSVMVRHSYSFQPSATDSDGSKPTFSITNKPWWATFSGTTGQLSGTPANGATFSNIVICASHGSARSCLPAFALKVTTPTTPPVITGSPAATATVGVAYSFQPAAHDPNGLSVTFGIFDKPSWLTFNSATGKLSGTPTAAQVGTYSHIGISASNGYHTAQLPSFSITVPSQGAALPPSAVTIAWTPPTENTNGSTLTNLAGYHIYYGTTQSNLSKVVSITNPGVASYVLSDLTSGTWYFALTSINSQGVESARSPVVSTSVE
ncbi:MAG TPA: putative Ig domain-containing protein [Steroidobacteraceae bacterium]|nr:putative Ig domain-containing protein [Steroidobacteraceae bacterium]